MLCIVVIALCIISVALIINIESKKNDINIESVMASESISKKINTNDGKTNNRKDGENLSTNIETGFKSEKERSESKKDKTQTDADISVKKQESMVAPNSPKAVIENDNIDLGIVPAGTPVKYRFYLRNDGKSDLIINNIKTSCARCSAAEMSRKSIPPNEEEAINVNLWTHNKIGENSYTVYISTNDPIMPQKTFKFKINLSSPLFIKENTIKFGEIISGKSPTLSLKIHHQNNLSIKDESLAYNNEYFNVKILNTKEEERGIENKFAEYEKYLITTLSLSVKESVPFGEIYEHIEIKSGDYKAIANITGRILGPITIDSKDIFFGIIKDRQEIEKCIRIKTNDSNFRIEGYSSDIENIIVESKKIKEEMIVTLKYTPLIDNGHVEGEIVLRTNSKVYPEIKLNARALLKIK